MTKRYTVVKAFDYLTAGRTYTFGVGRAYVNVRRVDDPETGTYLQPWQFRQALANGWVVAA